MKTGIEKFDNVISNETCDLLINHIENNMDKTVDLEYGSSNKHEFNNVICKELFLNIKSELDHLVHESIVKVVDLYSEQYQFFNCIGDVGYQLRRISGETREHIDNLHSIHENHTVRNVSIILGLNSDYQNGEFHFPLQDFSTTVKRGEAIVFPVYFMYPHYVDAPIGYRYTINTWITEYLPTHVRSSP